MATFKVKTKPSVQMQTAEITRLGGGSFPSSGRRQQVSRDAGLLHQSLGRQEHSEALTGSTSHYYQKVCLRCRRLAGHWGADQQPREMPVRSPETAPQSPVCEANLLSMLNAVAKQTTLPQQLFTKMETKPTKQQKGYFKCGGLHLHRNC